MSKKTKSKKECRKAVRAALEDAFVSSLPLDNIFEARALVNFLQGVEFLQEEPPGRRAMYGYGQILALIDILLGQACQRIELKSSQD